MSEGAQGKPLTHDGVRNFWGRYHREGAHHPVRVFFSDLGEQEGAHTGASTTSQALCDLKALKAIAALGLLADHIQHGIDQLSALGVVALGPVVASTTLPVHKVVRAEKGTIRPGLDGFLKAGVSIAKGGNSHHCAWLQIDQDGSRDVFSSMGFVVVDVDTLQLQVVLAAVDTLSVYAVLVTDDSPELGANLVATLTHLKVYNLTHVC